MARENNAEYWARRFKNMEDALQDQSFAYAQNLETQFAAAQTEIERQMAVWYQRFAVNNEISYAEAKRLLNTRELAEFRWTVGEYIAYGQQNALDGRWMKQLENASARVHISRLESLKLQIQQQAESLYANQLDTMDAVARRMYEGSYYHTAFELQRGLGVGWTMHAINEATITKVLSRPWTADNQTFRDRCWANKQSLVNAVNTQLTQMIIRGEGPDQAISAIAKQFGVARNKAGRLVMTESAYFASAAQRDCYAALDVERYEIIASFDHETCELCAALDGEVFKMPEYQVGLTAPPFHPWCRCCTCPYFEDMAGLGERWSRNEDGTTVKVPANTTFEDWKKQFVRNEDEFFQPMVKYKKADGSFDINAAKNDYRIFLQSVPEKNRLYLQQSMDAVDYQRRDLATGAFSYSAADDAVFYNPDRVELFDYDFHIVNTHELAHRIDRFFVKSWTNSDFSKAVSEARNVVAADPDRFIKYCRDFDDDGLLSDILSAVCEDDYRFPFYHEKEYWQQPEKKELEVFANLFSLEVMEDSGKLDFIAKNFSGLLNAYQNLPYVI